MITRLYVRNFKAFDSVDFVDLPRFLCLIGVNGSGKTTFIQLLTFVRALVRGEVDNWRIGDRQCETKALAFAGSLRRNFELLVEFVPDGEREKCIWTMTYNLYDGQLIRENLTVEGESVSLISFESGVLKINGEESKLALVPKGAALSLPIKDDRIDRMRHALSDFVGVGVLDPVAISDPARPSRGQLQVEENGHRLAAFVSQLTAEQQAEYTRTICEFYGDFETIGIKGSKFGWKRLVFTELKKSIDALHMSYGTLRFMVLAALKYCSASLLYFDEVDNGINQEYLGRVVALLRSFCDKQVVVTTHNVQFLNNLSDDELRRGVFFFYKDKQHRTRVKRFFDIDGMSNALDVDAAGSIVSMTDLVKLGDRLVEAEPEVSR